MTEEQRDWQDHDEQVDDPTNQDQGGAWEFLKKGAEAANQFAEEAPRSCWSQRGRPGDHSWMFDPQGFHQSMASSGDTGDGCWIRGRRLRRISIGEGRL